MIENLQFRDQVDQVEHEMIVDEMLSRPKPVDRISFTIEDEDEAMELEDCE